MQIIVSAKCALGSWENNGTNDKLLVNGIETDSRKDCSNKMFLALMGEKFDGHKFIDMAISNGAMAICLNKNFTYSHLTIPILKVDDSLIAYQNIANSHRNSLDITVIGITGSCGKTSSKDILNSVLLTIYSKSAICATIKNTNNHIGVPQNLLRLNKYHKYAIIEMGTNHPGEISVLSKISEPNIAIISSIGSSHIENFNSIDNIAKEKLSIMQYAKKEAKLILPFDCKKYIKIQKNIIYFGESSKANYCMNYIKSDIENSLFEINNQKVSWKVTGKHQALNATAVIATCAELGIPIKQTIDGLKNVVILGMRMKVLEIDNVKWINDAYNANPESMIAIIDWFSEFTDGVNLKMILGDMLELGEQTDLYHKQILKYVQKKLPKSQLFTVGENMRRADENIINYSTSQIAKCAILKLLKPQEIVFLKGSRGMALEKIIPSFTL